LRAVHEGHGNHDPLALASRELVGIIAGAAIRLGNSYGS
jgi:hypothetical protein